MTNRGTKGASSAAALVLCAAAGSAFGTTAPKAACAWDHPGLNPYSGDVVQAVDRYRDIAPDVRERLKARMEKRQYDDIVTIRRDAIEGHGSYDPAIRDMQFGPGALCKTVTRERWTDTMQERGLVYCEGGECILVPTVCRNVSRITRTSPGDASDPERALAFAPPGAGDAAPSSFAEGAGVPLGGGAPTGEVPLSAGPPGAGFPLGTVPSSNPGPFGPSPIGPLLPPAPSVPIPEPAGWMLGLAAALTLLLARFAARVWRKRG